MIERNNCCKCGCGNKISHKSTWYTGHYIRTEEIKKQLSIANSLAWKQPEIRQKYLNTSVLVSQRALAECRKNPEWVNNQQRGLRALWEKSKAVEFIDSHSGIEFCVGAIGKSKWFSKYIRLECEGCKKLHWARLRKGIPEIKLCKSCVRKGKKGHSNPKLAEYNRTHIRCGINHPGYGKHGGNAGVPRTPEWNARISKAHIKILKDPQQRQNYINRIFSHCHVRPNKAESALDTILQKYFPNEWRYTGDFSVVLGGKSPDWTNCNGEKSVILLHGLYWHLQKAQKKNPSLTKEQVEARDIQHYKEFGFNCLIIWEDELKESRNVVSKVRVFSS